jgi:hypothetical protein
VRKYFIVFKLKATLSYAELRCMIVEKDIRILSPPNVNVKAAFSKASTLESVFEKLRFRLPKTPDTLWTQRQNGGKKSIRIRVDGALY